MGETNFTQYTKRSMIQNDINSELAYLRLQLSKTQSEYDNMTLTLEHSRTPVAIVKQYIELKHKRQLCVNKKRKEVDRELTKITVEYPMIDKDTELVSKYNDKSREIVSLQTQLETTEHILETDIDNILYILKQNQFITENELKNEEKQLTNEEINQENTLTIKGNIASYLREVHPLIFAELLHTDMLQTLEPEELIGILSCFTNVSVSEENRALTPQSNNPNVQRLAIRITEMYEKHQDLELEYRIETDFDYSIHYDLIDYCIQWSKCESQVECKMIIQTIALEKEIYLGEFVKAILKINNISAELEKVAEYLGDMAFLSSLKKIPLLTLKYIATNQSLYI